MGQPFMPLLFCKNDMSSLFHMMDFIQELTRIPERQRKNEQKAAQLILDILRRTKTSFHIQHFQAITPIIQKTLLMADKKKIPAIATCFISGTIQGKHALTS